MSTRTERIGSVIQREVSQFFAEILDEEEYGMVTITKVRVLEDLSEARISVSVMHNAEHFLMIAQKRAGFIRRNLRHRFSFKKTPKFIFQLDTSAEYAEKIEDLLKN